MFRPDKEPSSGQFKKGKAIPLQADGARGVMGG
jgi:hypothetical protein